MAIEYSFEQIASQVRRDIVRMVTNASSGHPGGSLSSTDVLTYLYFKQMNASPETWSRSGKGSDMFFLSAGHISPVLYSVLARRGYFPLSELSTFRKLGSRLQGHPCTEQNLPGVHQAAGSLGQGLSVAMGVALAKRLDSDKSKVYVLIGDGESQEGQIWEAAMSAVHNKIDNLIAMTDWNHQQIDGTTEEVASLGDLNEKWSSFGWSVVEGDGHDFSAIKDTFDKAAGLCGHGKPVMILWHTVMGKGVDYMEGTCEWHGKAPSVEKCETALNQLDETMGDF